MFDFYVGVDQTGAVQRTRQGHRYKPLQAAVVYRHDRNCVYLRAADRRDKALTLPAFTPIAIRNVLAENMSLGAAALPSIAVLVDCVLGLPRAEKLTPLRLRDFFQKAAMHEKNSREQTGRAKAAQFFDGLLMDFYDPTKFPAAHRFPRRLCEELTGSNSVFQKHPFQKNIQSGTFRIWSDLGAALPDKERHEQDLAIWPHDPSPPVPAKAGSLVIAEGYPSFYWRKIFAAPSRQPAKIRDLATRVFAERNFKITCDGWDIIANDPDAADAAVLAMSGFLMDLDGRLFPPASVLADRCGNNQQEQIFMEGWIAGVPLPTQITR